MHPLAYIVMIFGGILSLIGIILFIKKGIRGKNVIKIFGFEIQISDSSLVIFLIGVIVFLYPFIYPERFPQLEVSNNSPNKNKQNINSPSEKKLSESELEESRKPKINLKFKNCISTDTTLTIDGISISNIGNVECNISRIFLVTDLNNLVKIDFPEANIRHEENSPKDKLTYELYLKGSKYGEMIIMDGTSNYIPFKIIYKSVSTKFQPYLVFRIDCLSRYKNSIVNFIFAGCDLIKSKN